MPRQSSNPSPGQRRPVVFVLNGANINMVGVREPAVYGTRSYDDICKDLAEHAKARGVSMEIRQSNHEGDIVDWLHQAHDVADGVILNPGGFTRSSVAIFDAVKAIRPPVIELHLSNTAARAGRPPPITTGAAAGVIAGFGGFGYRLALDAVLAVIAERTR